MHKFKRIIEENLILKITSLSSAVIGVRLIISLFIQRILAQLIGEAGIYKVGQLRSSIQMLASIGTLGTFNGIVKYVSEFKESQEELKNIFSSTFIITFFGSLVSVILLLTFSEEASYYLFKSYDYSYFIKQKMHSTPSQEPQGLRRTLQMHLISTKRGVKEGGNEPCES